MFRYWRLTSIPELDMLNRAQRASLDRHIDLERRHRRLIARSIALGFVAGAMAAGAIIRSQGSWSWITILFGVLLAAAVCPLAWQWQISQQRRLLAELISELFVDQPAHQCPHCGYDLRASPGDICPECGHERSIPRPPLPRIITADPDATFELDPDGFAVHLDGRQRAQVKWAEVRSISAYTHLTNHGSQPCLVFTVGDKPAYAMRIEAVRGADGWEALVERMQSIFPPTNTPWQSRLEAARPWFRGSEIQLWRRL